MLDWHDLDDNQLLQKAKEGEADAFGELYERHVNAVHRFLYARLDSRMDAEDFAEEVFLKAWNSLAKYSERGIPFRAYLLIIARNVLIDHHRRNGRAPQRVSIEDMQISDFTPDPGELSSINSKHQELRNAAVNLYEIESHSQAALRGGGKGLDIFLKVSPAGLPQEQAHSSFQGWRRGKPIPGAGGRGRRGPAALRT